ncbi:Cell cycle serine/threonine-protein kinase cdc5/MSD2 [Actinomortierella ambigua]|nr:Cell cycle serine/threonine-protein kinase cdc5/MSD2 [Actinomortierella ambigua]
MNTPLVPRRPTRKLQYQHGAPSEHDSPQYGTGNQPGGMTGISSTLGGNNASSPRTQEASQPINNTATASTITAPAVRKIPGSVRRAPGLASVPAGVTTAGATETAPLVDKPKGKRKDKVPRLPPPQTIIDGVNKKTYTCGRSLGEGGFASCYELRDEDGKRFAAKVIQKVELNTHKTKAKLFAEIKIHQALRHENIVRYYTCFEDDNFVYLLLELCESKTLMDLLKRRKVVTEPEARYYMKEIVAACAHLHQGKIIHRDLKLGNIFLSYDMHVKVGDFGLAALLQSAEERKRTICGTPNYIAPEILFETSGHSFEVDIWSLGCIMYTLLIGKPPFQTNDVKSIYKNIRELNYSFPPEIPISTEAKALITALLSPKPEQRPTVNTILQDPFFTNGFCPESLPRTSQHTKPKFDQEIALFQRQKRQARHEEEWLQQQRAQQTQSQHDPDQGARQSLPTPTVHRQQQKLGIPVAKRASPAPSSTAHPSANGFGFGDEVRMEMVRGDQVITEVRTVNVPRASSIQPSDQYSGAHLQQGQHQLYSMSHRQSAHYAPHEHHTESTVASKRQSSLSRIAPHAHSLSHQQNTGSKASRDAIWQMRMGQYSSSTPNSANPPSASSASVTLAHGSPSAAAIARSQRLPQPSSASTVALSRLPKPTSRYGQGISSPLASPRLASVSNMGMQGSEGFSPVTPSMDYPQDVPSSPHAPNHLRRMSSDLASANRLSNPPFSRPSLHNAPVTSPFNGVQRTPTFGGARTLPSNARSLKAYREQLPIDESMDMDMEPDKSMEALDDDDDYDRLVHQQGDEQQEDQERGFPLTQRTSSGSTLIQTVTGIERPASAMKRTNRLGNPFSIQSSHGRGHLQSGLPVPSASKIEYPSKELQGFHMSDNTEDDLEALHGGRQPSQPAQAATPTRAGFNQGHSRHSSQHVASSQLSPFSHHSRHLSQQTSQPLQRSASARQQQGSTLSQQPFSSSPFSQPVASEMFSSQPMERNRSDQGTAANDEWFPTSPSPASRTSAVGHPMGLERVRPLSQYQRGNFEVGPLDSLPHITRSSQHQSPQVSNLDPFMPVTRNQRHEQMYNDSEESEDREMESIERHVPMNDKGTITSTIPATPSRPSANDPTPSTPTQPRATTDRLFRRRSSHHNGLHRPRPDVVQDSRQQLQQQRQQLQQQQLQLQQQQQHEQQEHLRLQREQDLAKRLQQQQQLAQQGGTVEEVKRRELDVLVQNKRDEGETAAVEEFKAAVKFQDESHLVPVRQEEDTMHSPSDRPLQETHMSGHSGEQDHVEVPSTSGGATSLSLSICADKALGPLESVHKYLGMMLREYKLGKFPSAYATYATRSIPPELLVLPSPIPTCYVARWCDYSLSYGTGFGTVNGVTGVLFNDGCVGLLAPNDINVEYIIHPNSGAAKKSRRSRSHRSRHSRESGAESGSASDNPGARMTESTSSLEGSGRGVRRDSKHRSRSKNRSVSRGGGGADMERRGRDPTVSNNVAGSNAGGSEDARGSLAPINMTSSTTLLHKKRPSLTSKTEGSSSSFNTCSSPTTPSGTPVTPTATTGGEQVVGGMVGEGNTRPSIEGNDRARAAWMSNGTVATTGTPNGGVPVTQEALDQQAKTSGHGDPATQYQDPNVSVSINLRKRQYHDAEDDAYEERLRGRRSVIGRRAGAPDTDTDGDSDGKGKETTKQKHGQRPMSPFLSPLITAASESTPSPQSASTPTVTAAKTFAGPAVGGGGAGGRGMSPQEGKRPVIHGDLNGEVDDESEESWDEEDVHTMLKSVERECFTRDRPPSRLQPRIKMLPQFRDYMLKQNLDVPLTTFKDMNLVADMPFISGFYQIKSDFLILRLSDGTVQINFQDHEKLVFSDHGRALIYIHASKRIFTMSLKNAFLGIVFERKKSSTAATISLAGLEPPSPNPLTSGATAGSPQSPADQQPQRQGEEQQDQQSQSQPPQQQPKFIPPPPPPPPPPTDTYRGIILHPMEHTVLITKLKMAYQGLQRLARIRKVKRKQKGPQEEIIITAKKIDL